MFKLHSWVDHDSFTCFLFLSKISIFLFCVKLVSLTVIKVIAQIICIVFFINKTLIQTHSHGFYFLYPHVFITLSLCTSLCISKRIKASNVPLFLWDLISMAENDDLITSNKLSILYTLSICRLHQFKFALIFLYSYDTWDISLTFKLIS